MIGKTNGGGGRDRFRPNIYGGTTAPSKPKDGDFWVYTGTTISGTELNGFMSGFPTWTMPEGFGRCIQRVIIGESYKYSKRLPQLLSVLLLPSLVRQVLSE